MSYPKRSLIICVLICVGLAGVSRADEPQLLPRAGVLVFKTGRVLHGKISHVGDRYVVALAEQDEVTVPVESVEMWCDCLENAYQRKRDLLPSNAKATEHLQLADWCLRYDLIPAAAEQLMAAQRRDPLDPANARFEKRLRLAVQRPTTAVASTVAPSLIASQSELDELARGLPSGTVEQFTNSVQPLLINRCGATNCHGPNTQSDFQLVYPNWSHTLPRRFTQQNLKMAIGLLDRDQPARSPLLMMATLAHGGAETPPLTEGDVPQLQSLAEWVYRSLNNSNSLPPTVLTAPDALLMQPLDRGTNVSAHPPTDPAAPRRAADVDAAGIRVDTAVARASHLEPAGPAAAPIPPTGTDPFDPEIFNRRFLK